MFSPAVKMLWSLLLVFLIAHVCTKELLNGATSQSSNYVIGVPYLPGRAFDRNKSLCAHTLEENNSWWRVDLLAVYEISSVRIYNLAQQNADITGARIRVGNSCDNNCSNDATCEAVTNFQLGTYNNFTFPGKTASGRYVSVFSTAKKPMILCEVEIYGTKRDSPFILIKKNKTWEDALDHCRDQDMDLASILDSERQAWAELEAMKANTPFVWLGLHYTCTLGFWFWVDDHPVAFCRWASNGKTEACYASGAMETSGAHEWYSMSDGMFNFICAKW